MHRKTAIKLGIEALDRWKKEYAWDCNLYRKGVEYIGGERAVKKVKRIEDAIKHLEEML